MQLNAVIPCSYYFDLMRNCFGTMADEVEMWFALQTEAAIDASARGQTENSSWDFLAVDQPRFQTNGLPDRQGSALLCFVFQKYSVLPGPVIFPTQPSA